MNAFIENNRKLLVFYYWVARIGGWVFLSMASLTFFGKFAALASRIGDMEEFRRFCEHDVPWGMFSDVLPTGVLILGISQLIWYLLDTDRPARWVLRQAHQLLYLYTTILLVYYCWAGILDVQSVINEPYGFLYRMILFTMFILVKLLALVGVAELLRRLLPVIDESRTLV
jgi:hypothetical protein